ncbi:DnaB-like helicase C-terminal domain-containing protein [Mycoplasmopsis sturni]|uniref:DnaB-like helicase C-terminal domain-containing protein n=1 Tax=Mycoplasmopsis sturni TaxID=39047 RepID=UPI00055B1A83|nr:DnaB-like helicase C-terminal domain-containing protein [Mycoplasmopsis sturni]
MFKDRRISNRENYIQLLTPQISADTVFYDRDLERQILSTMISYSENQEQAIQYVQEYNFFNIQNRQLFLLIKKLKELNGSTFAHFGIVELENSIQSDEIRNSGLFNDIDDAFIAEIALVSSNTSHFLGNLDRLMNLTKMRYLEAFYKHQIKHFNNQALTNESQLWSNAFYELQNFLDDNSQNAIDDSIFVKLSDTSNELIQKVSDIKSGRMETNYLMTGFDGIDNRVHGFKPGQLIILAARPGVGKTALALNIARNIAFSSFRPNSGHSRPKNVAFISLEMSNHELTSRFFASNARVELQKIQVGKYLTNDEFNALKVTNVQFSNLGVYFDDKPSGDIDEIAFKIRKHYNDLNGQLDLVIVDYLQLIQSKRFAGNRQNEVATISRTLKTLALELKIPILALSQLSRNVEHREDKLPQLQDLRDSGQIEQDADIVIFLSRNKDNTRENQYNTVLSIAKNRMGEPGIQGIQYEGQYVLFKEYRKEN